MWSNVIAQEQVFSGTLQDNESGEVLPFATIQVKSTRYGTTSDENGKYSFTIPNGVKISDSAKVRISYLGYKKFELTLKELSNSPNVKLSKDKKELQTFEVVASVSEEEKQIKSTQMSAVKLDMKEIKHLPAIGGEVDIIKVAQLLPGISGGVEGTTGIYVRGGNADQNLVLYDDATLYDIGHLFGFYSIFNNDVLQDITILKGGFPANYGGRLSSIIDVSAKDQFIDTISGAGGIGLLSSRLTVQAPFAKKKGNILLSGRRTYIDQVLKLVDISLPYYFYDLNAKVGFQINAKNNIWYSIYYGKDLLKFDENSAPGSGGPGGGNDSSGGQFNSNAGYDKVNIAQSINWNHIYNSKLQSNIALVSSTFKYDIDGKFDNNRLAVRSNILDVGLKPSFSYRRKKYQTILLGGELTYRNFKPNIVKTEGDISEFLKSSSGTELNNVEYAVYGVSKYYLFNTLLALDVGARISGSSVAGKTYLGFEPRIAARYTLNENNTVKLSYSKMKQYIHRVSSSTVVLPTDLWYPVTSKVKPMAAHQVAIGYEHLFKKLKTTASVEGYYKRMQNVIEYKEGANLILNNNFEDELTQGIGDAYGAEFLLKKRRGKFHGWMGYTLAWSTRKFEDLNNGERFWAKYDRRHDFSTALNYDLTKRLTLSAVWVYSSGARFTAQIGQYVVPNPSLTGYDIMPIFSKRNEISMSPSHRLDFNIVIKPKPKVDRKWYGEWYIGCYNLYNRATPYQIEIKTTPNGYKYTQPGLFGFLPYFSYNFKF